MQRRGSRRYVHCDAGGQLHRVRSVPDPAEPRGRAVLDGGLHGDDDPLHPAPSPTLRVGDRPVQAGLPHHHCIHR